MSRILALGAMALVASSALKVDLGSKRRIAFGKSRRSEMRSAFSGGDKNERVS